MNLHHEHERLRVLRGLGLLRADAPTGLEAFCHGAQERFQVPVALITLIDRDRQVIKARVGTDLEETPRSAAFCDHTIRTDEVLVAPDTARDPRFAANPLVTGPPHVRFYAGAPLIYMSGVRLGGLCLIDLRPRVFGPVERAELAGMAEEVMVFIIEHELARINGSGAA